MTRLARETVYLGIRAIGNLFSGNLKKITARFFRNIAVMHLAVILGFRKFSRNHLAVIFTAKCLVLNAQ